MSTVESEVAANPAASASTTEGNRYFDLHISGVGYLNRPREVPLKKGSFLAVEIAALRGEVSSVEYTRFDCRVSGSEAQTVIRNLIPEIEAKKKVLVGFKLGDLYPTLFVYDKGERQGQPGISLKAHLLRLSWVKVDGQLVYQAPRENAATAVESEAVNAEVQAEAQAA